MNVPQFFLVAIVFLTAAAAGAVEPLAVYECFEVTGRDWARTLVTYR